MSQIPPYQERPSHVAPHRGVLILVLGIVSLAVCAPIGIAAWVMGQGDLNKIKAGTMDPEGRGLTTAGMVCGIISTILFALGAVVYVLIFVIAGAAAMSGP